MKKIMLSVFFFLLFVTMSFAQCDKDVIISSTRTEYLDANDVVQHTALEKTIIEIGKTEITITPGDDPGRKMKGTITSADCHWEIPFKKGKSVIKADFINRAGEAKSAVITIGDLDGKIVFLLEAGGTPALRIKVVAGKFEEKK